MYSSATTTLRTRWLDGSRYDWVEITNPTDRSAGLNGCPVLFQNWLQTIQHYGWCQIPQAGAVTLAGTPQKLSGKTTIWADFSAAVSACWPVGVASGVTTHNPHMDSVQPIICFGPAMPGWGSWR